MPAITVLGQYCTGHGGFPPRPNTQASGDVFAEGISVHRIGDAWFQHCHDSTCHGGVTSSGSGSVFVNGVSIARIGDEISCGSKIAQGVGSVFAGG